MQATRQDLRDWLTITIIILIGFLLLILAGSMAIRFSPSWELAATMSSNIDPNSDFLTHRPSGFIPALDVAILTPPAWLNVFQTPGASVPARTPLPTLTAAPQSTSVVIPPTVDLSTATAVPTNTIWYIPASPTRMSPPVPVNTATPSPIPPSPVPPTPVPTDADLQITKSDGVLMYTAGQTLTYTIVITNNGPADAIGATLTDAIPAQVSSWIWECMAQNLGASGCDAASSNSDDFSDTVDLPNQASIEYKVTASISAGASANMTNSATVTVPQTITDLTTGNNTIDDVDQLIFTSTFPMGNIGNTPDTYTDVVKSGTSVIFTFSSPLIVTAQGHAGYDLVYYELPNGTGIAMDLVILELGDGNNWYPIFNWGNNAPDTNSNLDISKLGGVENDNRDFTTQPASDILFNSTGVLIDVDSMVQPGTYPYIRLTAPTTSTAGNDSDGGCEVDAIVILP